MIGGFVTHVLTYVAVCVFLSLVWVLLGGGSLGELRHFLGTPGDALSRDFWPVWVWLTWGVAVVVHLAALIGRMMQPSYWRRRRAEWIALRDIGPVRGLERRWLAVMFTDIVNSTALNESLGDEEWSRVLVRHREAVRACTMEHGGTEVTTQGDGFLVRFDAPADAVLCAVALQERFSDERTSGVFTPEVRIGVHSGEAVDHGRDVLGQMVNLASRVTSAAAPGEILVTEPVADALGGRFPLVDRGLVNLRGIGRSRHVLAVTWRAAEIVLDDIEDIGDSGGVRGDERSGPGLT